MAYFNWLCESSTTGIRSVQGEGFMVTGSDNSFYTLDGRFAGTDYNSLQRGIYVTNGKKVIR